MSRPADQDAQKSRKPWTTPALRDIKLTEDEFTALRTSEDPMGLLLKLKPELKRPA